MRGTRVALCAACIMAALAPSAFAKPLGPGVELALTFPLTTQGDLPRGAGFEINFFIGPYDEIGVGGLLKDWRLIGLNYMHYFDPLDSEYFYLPVKARLGLLYYYDDSSWGISIGAGPSAIAGWEPAPEPGSESDIRGGMFGRADALAEVFYFARSYYGSHFAFVPTGTLAFTWIYGAEK
jgi:hypothetical protein